MNMEVIFNVIGLCGAALILLGFYSTSTGKWQPKSFIFALDNLAGAVLLIIYQAYYHAYINVGLNIIWSVIALRSLVMLTEKYARKRRQVAVKSRR